MDRILVVDDDRGTLLQLKWALSKEYEVLLAGDAETALKLLEEGRPDIAILDVALSEGGREGLEVLAKIAEEHPDTKAIVMTGIDDKEVALEAIEMGACDYYRKPVDVDELKVVIKRTLNIQKLERENRLLRRLGQEPFEEMIGTCPKMLEVFEAIGKVATTDATVLVTGESGTGKELVARAIHFRSLRKEGPFVVVNCGAIPENLLESELFGHERGSFTGAYRTQKGKIELADGGTIFLDEVGELPPALQVKLLRFIQEKEIDRIGGGKPVKVDVRIIAATNRDLKERMLEGAFREDLYYRLSVVTIELPPLRERGEDIMLLANYFLNRFSSEVGKDIKGFTKDALQAMRSYTWPGNVRELENRVRKAVIMTENSVISSSDLGLAGGPRMTLREAKDRLEREMIREALERTGGNISRSARELGISRATLHDLLKKHNIDLETYRR
ncbi:MAG: PEP-CTERM-box response regulator transcription factor [Candidatus Latescibacterota bacterium]|nr:MAG: PEP-CTERM-box response regulator transcription factor [Candidatus Latescibacterota bacterium]RKY73455.1 MAG: PEP-CTERM-box response regulator transcription factor [Candidatus Latescibacterota bacterium]HDH99949.1 PEP-CTERM-box response regulator transcription factor [Bacillota bacterium]